MFGTEFIKTGLLIIGGGAAGLRAAIEAKRWYDDITVVCKRHTGSSGNSMVAGGGFAIDVEGTKESRKSFFENTIKAGWNINDEKLVKILVDESAARIKELEEFGVQFLKENGRFVTRRPPGHSSFRSVVTRWDLCPVQVRGLVITRPLRSRAASEGIKFLENCHIIKLITQDQKITGAIGVDLVCNQLLFIQTNCILIASGGGGHIFKNTNNTPEMTGDSYILGLEAGALLRDMEFIQFYPTMASDPIKMGISSPLLGEGAVLRNKSGERFMVRYNPVLKDMATRDEMSRAIYWEVEKGNGIDGKVYLDCTAVPEEVLEKKFKVLIENVKKRGLDLKKQYILISPTVLFIMGGIKFDESGFTGVEGLYTAGEAAGGLHGANRIGGNALTETQVFGVRAGKAAAIYSKDARIDRNYIKTEEIMSEFNELSGEKDQDLLHYKKSIQKILWENGGIVRTANGLKKGIEALIQLRDQLNNRRASSPKRLAELYEIKQMCKLGIVILNSAYLREESRGAHYRADFPDSRDSEWLGSITASDNGSELLFKFIPKNLKSNEIIKGTVRYS